MTELENIKALLHDDLFPDSKVWTEGTTLERAQWLLKKYQTIHEEAQRLNLNDLYYQQGWPAFLRP